MKPFTNEAIRKMTNRITPTMVLLILGTFVVHVRAQDTLLATSLVDSGSMGTGQLVNTATNIAFSWTEKQDSGTTTFSLNTTPSVNGAKAWYVDTDSGDMLTITLNFDVPVAQPLFFIERMDDADFDFGVTHGVDAFIVEQTGGMVESSPNLFTAPSGLDAASGTIALSGSYSRVSFSISSVSGRDVVHIAAGADSVIQRRPCFSSLEVASGIADLELTDLLIGSTTTVQKAESLLSPAWTNVTQFISSSSSTNISDTATANQTVYRFLQE